MQAMAYGDGTFVTGGWSSGVSGTTRRIAVSTDLATWSEGVVPADYPATANLRRAAYGNGLFAIGGWGSPLSNTHKLITSPDGATWTTRDVKLGAIFGLSYVNNLWIALGEGGTAGGSASSLATSADGITWTARATGSVDDLNAAAFGAGLFVAVGQNSQVVTSPDGMTWTRRTLAQSTVALTDVVFAEGKFVACAENGRVYLSTDGLAWTERTVVAGKRFYGIAHGNGTFVIAGDLIMLSSPDGETWTTDTTNVRPVRQVVFGGGVFAAGGDLGTVYRSGAPTLPGPTLSAQPQAVSAVAGGSATFRVAATGNGPLRYQWRLNGTAISGATSATLTLTGAQVVAGSYTVVVTDNDGHVTSSAAVLSIVTASDRGRLANLAIRTAAGTGDQTLVVGFTVGGAGTVGPKALLVRGAGPALASFGVGGALADPVLSIFQGQTAVDQNDDWAGGFDFAAVGAFAYAGAMPKDAAIYKPDVPSGSYTAQIVGKNNATGVALAEVYDATPAANFSATTPRLINVAARAGAGTGDATLVAGFVVTGGSPVRVLLRSVGPTLTGFGVSGVLADPSLTVYDESSAVIASNDNWGGTGALQEAFAAVGAFGLATASTDAALVLTLQPGAYTAHTTGAGGATGVALFELYELP